MRKNVTVKIPVGIEIRRVPLTAEQKAATEKMLAASCPYCSDPKKFQRELVGKGREDHRTGIARIGKFWARDDEGGMLVIPVYDHGDYFRLPIGSEHFIPRFKDFRLDIINFGADYSPWAFASNSLLFGLSAAPSDIARFNKFPFNVARVTHKKSAVVVDAHTWFSHGTVITVHHVPKQLSSADITVMREALEFFRPETRGAPKVKDAELFQAIKALGAGATQTQVAKRLGVSKSTVSEWLKRQGWAWDELKRGYLEGRIL